MIAHAPGWAGRLRGGLDLAARVVLLAGLSCLVAIATMTIWDVIGRWAFNRPLTGSSDIAEVALPVVVAASLPALIASRGQITIRFAQMILPRRITLILDVIAELLGFAVLTGLTLAIGDYALGLYTAGETTWIIGLPLWPTWAGFAALTGFAALMQIFALADTLWGRVMNGHS